jgi:ADP-ribose pyrophosphatase
MEHEEAELEVFRTPMADLLDAVLDGRVQQGPLAASILAYDVLKRRGEL